MYSKKGVYLILKIKYTPLFTKFFAQGECNLRHLLCTPRFTPRSVIFW